MSKAPSCLTRYPSSRWLARRCTPKLSSGEFVNESQGTRPASRPSVHPFIHSFIHSSIHPSFISLVRDRFVMPRVNREERKSEPEGRGEEGGVERSGRARRAENKKRAKWPAGPVVSCDRKWHSFLAFPSTSISSNATTTTTTTITTVVFHEASRSQYTLSLSLFHVPLYNFAPRALPSPPSPRRAVTYPFLHARMNTAATTKDWTLLATR